MAIQIAGQMLSKLGADVLQVGRLDDELFVAARWGVLHENDGHRAAPAQPLASTAKKSCVSLGMAMERLLPSERPRLSVD